MAKDMLINVSEGEECRIALVEDGRLEELYVERSSSASHVGNIYTGRVTNVEASIQAAFVDFGLGRNGFLHVSDLLPDYFGKKGEDVDEFVGKKMARRDRPPIQRCLRRGDKITVQVIKEGIGTKGPTLSSYLSVSGKMLVMMPGVSGRGVSRKIEDEQERRRLKQILDSLDPPDDCGFILRTEAFGKTRAEIERDLTYLARLWEQMKRKRDTATGAVELYTEGDLVTRTIRDLFSADVDRLIVDNEAIADEVREVARLSNPKAKDRVEAYTGPIPLFHKYGIERDIELMYSRHVPLPSGGSLVIDSTEAVVAIDVNSGKFREHNDAEMTAFKTDMEAADEICRQLRVRDLGGVIICDFIDLRYERNRRELEERIVANFKKDRAKTKVLRMSQFGIIEITRQRMRPSLKKSVYFDCPQCKGAGLVKTPESMGLDVMRRLAIALNDAKVVRAELSVCADVAHYLSNVKRRALADLEDRTDKAVTVRADAAVGLDEMKLDLFDNRDGMVLLPELADTLTSHPHTSQLSVRQPGQTASGGIVARPGTHGGPVGSSRGVEPRRNGVPAAGGARPPVDVRRDEPRRDEPRRDEPRRDEPRRDEPRRGQPPAREVEEEFDRDERDAPASGGGRPERGDRSERRDGRSDRGPSADRGGRGDDRGGRRDDRGGQRDDRSGQRDDRSGQRDDRGGGRDARPAARQDERPPARRDDARPAPADAGDRLGRPGPNDRQRGSDRGGGGGRPAADRDDVAGDPRDDRRPPARRDDRQPERYDDSRDDAANRPSDRQDRDRRDDGGRGRTEPRGETSVDPRGRDRAADVGRPSGRGDDRNRGRGRDRDRQEPAASPPPVAPRDAGPKDVGPRAVSPKDAGRQGDRRPPVTSRHPTLDELPDDHFDDAVYDDDEVDATPAAVPTAGRGGYGAVDDRDRDRGRNRPRDEYDRPAGGPAGGPEADESDDDDDDAAEGHAPPVASPAVGGPAPRAGVAAGVGDRNVGRPDGGPAEGEEGDGSRRRRRRRRRRRGRGGASDDPSAQGEFPADRGTGDAAGDRDDDDDEDDGPGYRGAAESAAVGGPASARADDATGRPSAGRDLVDHDADDAVDDVDMLPEHDDRMAPLGDEGRPGYDDDDDDEIGPAPEAIEDDDDELGDYDLSDGREEDDEPIAATAPAVASPEAAGRPDGASTNAVSDAAAVVADDDDDDDDDAAEVVEAVVEERVIEADESDRYVPGPGSATEGQATPEPAVTSEAVAATEAAVTDEAAEPEAQAVEEPKPKRGGGGGGRKRPPPPAAKKPKGGKAAKPSAAGSKAATLAAAKAARSRGRKKASDEPAEPASRAARRDRQADKHLVTEAAEAAEAIEPDPEQPETGRRPPTVADLDSIPDDFD